MEPKTIWTYDNNNKNKKVEKKRTKHTQKEINHKPRTRRELTIIILGNIGVIFKFLDYDYNIKSKISFLTKKKSKISKLNNKN